MMHILIKAIIESVLTMYHIHCEDILVNSQNTTLGYLSFVPLYR